MAADLQSKARGLYQLYREEKAHEEKTRRMLNELESNNERLFDSKLKLLELVMETRVTDDMARQAAEDDVDMPQLNTELIEQQARQRMQNEVRAHAAESRDVVGDGFISQLNSLVRTDDSKARDEIAERVGAYTAPYLDKLRREKKRRTDGPLQSVARLVSEVELRRRAEIREQQHVRSRVDHSDRVRRVEQALGMLKRNIGDLTPLLHVDPVSYKTDIGKREAEEHDLRQLIARQRAEEERLLQERQVNAALIESQEVKLAAEVDKVCQELVLQQRELETKEMDLKELATAHVPGSGSWASSTLQLEKDLSLVIEEEYHLKHEANEVARTNELLQQEKVALDGDIAESVNDLAERQNDYQEVVKQIEARLNAAKQRLYRLRDDEVDMTHKINDFLYRILHRREDIRQKKRALREAINTVISQLSVEDRLQSALTARALELQTQAEKARAQMEHDIATLNAQFVRIQQDVKAKSDNIAHNAELLTNLWAGKRLDDQEQRRLTDLKYTPQQLQTQIDQLVNEWSRVEWDAASSVAQVAARIDHNRRENDRVLRQIGSYVIMQEDIGPESVDIAATTTPRVEQVRETLYAEATMRAYREAKYTQCVKLLRERLQQRSRGDRGVQPLTLNKHISLADRRARREASNRSRQAREMARQHIRNFSAAGEEGQSAVSRSSGITLRGIRDYLDPSGSTVIGSGASPSSVIGGAERAAAEHPEFRRVVIDFIKKEIQPLYDSSQITKKRFIDVVSRVSTWFLDTHRPTSELTEQNMNEISRAIQEVLTWQDEQRLGVRSP